MAAAEGGRTASASAVVFDIGGVILEWDPRHLYERLIRDPAQLDHFLSEVCTLEWNETFDAGTPFEDGCRERAEQFPEHAELISAWTRQDEMVRGEKPAVRNVIERLRDRGVPLYLLSNMPSEVFWHRLERFHVLRLFNGAVVSGAVGVIKPDPRIFELLCDRFGLEPSSTVFVDDSTANVDAALQLGFLAHRFTDVDGLNSFLATVRL